MLKKAFLQKLPPPKVIAVDVDKTLFNRGVVNKKLVELCIKWKDEGFTIIVWSSRGEQYARAAVEKAQLSNVVNHVIGKPGYIVDDQGWTWIKFTKVIKNLTWNEKLKE